ncbi:MAG: hypothetical protein NTW29_20595 [Bacteroidetes bacterium]|nr:hypothetical protein [Bacteroidota bacterium]
MRLHTILKAILLGTFVFFYSTAFSQVKIGGEPKEGPHPSSVLELKSTDKGFLLPRMSRVQINAITDPADALIVYDTDLKGVVIYSREQQQWLPLMQQLAANAIGSDTCEWAFDTTTLRVFLKRGYPSGDSIYYNTARKKFVFADKTTFGNATVPADVQFPGKFMVKGTASRIFNDSATLAFPSLTLANFLFEVDNDSFAIANPGVAFYNGMRISTQLLPTASQRVNTLRSLNLQVNNTSADTVNAVTSVVSNSFLDGQGFTSQFSGIQNNLLMGDGIKGVGTVTGYRNIITGSGSSTARVNGNVFGYQGNINGFTDSAGNHLINGNAYGIFLNSISGAAPKRNFAFYSNKGHNRFADSTLITDGGFISPRAVLDINATSAMIIPTGTTAQRPVTGVAGMFRNNTSLLTPEYFDGTTWQALSSGANEWKLDAPSNKVNLVRGLPLGDSIYYNVTRKKFVFADRLTAENNTSPVDEFYPGKYIFKGTASRIFHDAASLNFPSITLSNILLDVDRDSFAIANPNTAFYNGMRIATQMLPSAVQRASTIRSLLLQLNHTGPDSLNAVTALASNAFIDGKGFTSTFNGIQNNLSVSDSATGNIGSITGYRSILNMFATNGNRVLGNVFGYQGSMNGFADANGISQINGNAYGIFLNNVAVAAPGRNYAYYSNKGRNRFGDSTLITDGFFTAPRAVLDINSTSAMITPAGTSAQRPAAPIAAMLRFNSDGSTMEYYSGTAWKAFSSDTAEWRFDNTTNQVNLVRAMPAGDSIFYNPVRNNFIFADRVTNTNSLGQDFPVQDFGAKYTFKATASKRDSTQFNGANMNVVYEVDNTTSSTVYNSLSTSAIINPKAFQKSDLLTGITNTVIHAGNDSAQSIIGISNTTRNSGNGKAGSITGISNLVRIQNGNADNAGEMVGFRNSMIRTGATAGRVTGNVYGWLGTFSGFTNNVDGSIYGIFLSSVTGAGPRKNYAYYSNKGLNRLGDSVLITDGSAITPRAVLDINATSAIVIPAGTSAQRPATAVAGMVRYNTENGGRLESFNGTAWSGILSNTVSIDPPNMPSGSGATVSVVFNGATTGSAVAISPAVALPAGIIVAWARVSAANTIEVRFENNAGAPVNPAALNYQIKVIQ